MSQIFHQFICIGTNSFLYLYFINNIFHLKKTFLDKLHASELKQILNILKGK